MGFLYFEDLTVGKMLQAGPYEVTKEEIIEFASRWDPQPTHTDEAGAQASIFGGLTASGCHSFAISALLAKRLPERIKSVAVLATDELRFPRPVRPADQLWFVSECIARRASRSRPTIGIVSMRVTLRNQNDLPVVTMKTTYMVEMRPQQP
jgi:acyl dehydratase